MNKTEQEFEETLFVRKLYSLDPILYIQGGREISAITVTDGYLCYKEPKSPYNFFFFLSIVYELFKFKTSDVRQH